MHLYFLTRGNKQQSDLFKKFMETQMFLWKRKNLKTKQEELVQVQGALRPIELFEYVFPEESLDEVLTMLNMSDSLGKVKEVALRKMLGNGVVPIPKYNPVKSNRYVFHEGVAIYPIGIKKDKKEEVEKWGYEQELL